MGRRKIAIQPIVVSPPFSRHHLPLQLTSELYLERTQSFCHLFKGTVAARPLPRLFFFGYFCAHGLGIRFLFLSPSNPASPLALPSIAQEWALQESIRARCSMFSRCRRHHLWWVASFPMPSIPSLHCSIFVVGRRTPRSSSEALPVLFVRYP
jgi:hypothetical protein